MKTVAIRTKILVMLVLVNLIGALGVAVYLHESYSQSLDVTAQQSVDLGVGAWEQVGKVDDQFDLLAQSPRVVEILKSMKEITGADYGLLVDKEAVGEDAYAAARAAADMPDNWDEREQYGLLASTDAITAEKMDFIVTPDSVPEIGKIVGIENGACTKMCHDNVKGTGAYWAVAWSDDARSRTHAVFPVTDKNGTVAVVYTIQDITSQADSAEGSLLRTLLVIGITLLAATLIMGAMVDTLMFKRLNRMVDGIQELSVRVAGGDYNATYVPDDTDDEIGRFEKFFSNVIEVMTASLKSLSEKKAG